MASSLKLHHCRLPSAAAPSKLRIEYIQIYSPRQGTVLTKQAHHRSEDVFAGDVDRILVVRHGVGPFWRLDDSGSDDDGVLQRLHYRVIHMLYDMGFYGWLFDIDRHLITALVERWRPETHTFHFRVGEVTVTLQDVAVI